MAGDLMCPRCGAATEVKRTFKNPTAIRRVRMCKGPLTHEFETSESVPNHDLFVVKNGGFIVGFDRYALQRSIALAGGGTLDPDQVTSLADRVLLSLAPSPLTPLLSSDLGNGVLKELLVDHPSAAMRYATVFLSSRLKTYSASDLLTWIYEQIPDRDHTGPTAIPEVGSPRITFSITCRDPKRGGRNMRPSTVIKRGKTVRSGDWDEDFNLGKLARGLKIATKGLSGSFGTLDPNDPLGSQSAERDTQKDQEDSLLSGGRLVSTCVAFILEMVDGQRVVTTSQLSASAMFVLRSVCPLGYFRFALVAKKYTLRSQFIGELEELIRHPGPVIPLDPFRLEADVTYDELQEVYKGEFE